MVAALALTGCQTGTTDPAKTDAKPEEAVTAAGQISTESLDAPATEPAAKPSKSVRLVDRDVEAPEVFQITDTALWDGRPSLGGVWVASPDAVDPERVILRNPANGKFVIGALFRRERDNPGPKLQISSDAAAALGLLAGQPGKLNVTALRREEVPVTAPDARKPLLDVAETVDPETVAPPGAGTEATVATASAAIAKAEAKPAAEPAPEATAEAEAAALPPAPEADAPKPERKKFRLFGKKAAAPEAAPEAVAAAPLPLPSPAPSGATGAIQIGIFSVEANANRAASALTKAGLAGEIRKGEARGKAFWSVISPGSGDAAARLAKIKGLGYTDAYLLKR